MMAEALQRSLKIKLIPRLQDLVSSCPDGGVFGLVYPADGFCGVDENFSRSRNIRSVLSPFLVEQIITLQHRIIGRQKGVGYAELRSLAAIYFRRICADSDQPNAAAFKLREALLKTPQLGVAEWSPMSAVKYEQSRFWWCGCRLGHSLQKLSQTHIRSGVIRQGKCRSFISDTRHACRCRDPSPEKDAKGEESKRQDTDYCHDRT
jgi:hypothetical protein